MPNFYNHEVVQKSPDDYVEILCSPDQILSAWRLSMFAHELIDKNGAVKPQSAMQGHVLQKYLTALESLKRDEDIAKPILGVGMMDNIEIGIGQEIVAAAKNIDIAEIPVNVRKAQVDEVKKLVG